VKIPESIIFWKWVEADLDAAACLPKVDDLCRRSVFETVLIGLEQCKKTSYASARAHDAIAAAVERALFTELARRAGVNPTRQSFLSAFDTLGSWTTRVVLTERLSFARGKYDGADYFAVVQRHAQSGCVASLGPAANGCYRQMEGFRKGTW